MDREQPGINRAKDSGQLCQKTQEPGHACTNKTASGYTTETLRELRRMAPLPHHCIGRGRSRRQTVTKDTAGPRPPPGDAGMPLFQIAGRAAASHTEYPPTQIHPGPQNTPPHVRKKTNHVMFVLRAQWNYICNK